MEGKDFYVNKESRPNPSVFSTHLSCLELNGTGICTYSCTGGQL